MKKQWKGRWEKKLKKPEENKFTVTVKMLSWEFNLNWKYVCTDQNNDKNKKTFLYPIHSSHNFLNWWKAIKTMTLKL